MSLNPFTKRWLASTCAPESIKNIRSINNNYLDVVYNEDKSRMVYVLSNDYKVQGIGMEYEHLVKSDSYTFEGSLHKIAYFLQLEMISDDDN